MFDMCIVLAKRAERQAEIKAKVAAVRHVGRWPRVSVATGQRRRDRRRRDEVESGAPAAGPGVRSLGALYRCSYHGA
jgi:hypothetical protein